MNRDISIDLLRFVGLSCIIFAHINAPFVLNQLRCFDVPLMLFVSGLTCSGRSIPDYFGYMLKRTKRLLIPTWSFLLVWFVAVSCIDFVSDKPMLSLSYILQSFVLTGGLSYMWIIRVFLLIMVLTPFLLKIEKKMKSDAIFVISLVLIWGGILEILTWLNFSYISSILVQKIIKNFVLTAFAYSMFFILGIRMRYLSKSKKIRIVIFFSFVWCLALCYYIYSKGLPLELAPKFKYPPHSYYVLYGLVACSCLWLAKDILVRALKHKLFQFIGRNTIWIYFYHIVVLSAPMPENLILRYLFVFSGALLLFSIQYRVYLKVKQKFEFAKYLVG